jgi:hypothetical protein
MERDVLTRLGAVLLLVGKQRQAKTSVTAEVKQPAKPLSASARDAMLAKPTPLRSPMSYCQASK